MKDVQMVRIGGIKFSEELAQVSIACTTSDDSSLYQLLQLIAQKSINIPFLCHSGVTKFPESTFCVERSELYRVQQILNFSSFQNKHTKIIPSVGTLTLFPHKYSLRLLGIIMQFFGKHQFPIHSLCSSISTIAVNTDYILLDEIAEKLQNVLELPENHAPFRLDFRLTQIER